MAPRVSLPKFAGFVFLILALPVVGVPFETDVAKTFSSAKKNKKPLLIYFYGIWCPPCNELKEAVFENEAFKEKAKAFNLLAVDADKTQSWDLKHRFRVGGYPTVVFTDFKGEEVLRTVGFREPTEFLRLMEVGIKSQAKSILAACKSLDPNDLWRCASVCMDSGRTDCARTAFNKLEKSLKKTDPRYELARVFSVENEKSLDLKRLGYERLLKDLSHSPLAPFWAQDYLSVFEDQTTLKPNVALLDGILKVSPESVSSEKRKFLGVSEPDLLQARARLFEYRGQIEQAKKTWKEAATLLSSFRQKSETAGLKGRGYALEEAYCLERSGEAEQAKEILDKMIALFPQEFTYHFALASLKKRAKSYNEALVSAKKAFEYSYGDNRIRAATLLIQLYTTIPDKEAARNLYATVRGEFKVDPDLEVRTHRYLRTLDEAWLAASQ